MDRPFYRVGELAARTGMSVRTLRYYDQIGLLTPDRCPESGHRRYGEPEVRRLQQIRSLRQLGFSLEEIGGCLRRPDHTPVRVIRLHIERLREQMERQRRLIERLETAEKQLCASEKVSLGDLLRIIEEMEMIEKYYTPEQLRQLDERAKEYGSERIRQAEEDWKVLIENVRAEMERGTDPTSERVQQLAAQWRDLVNAFTGGDPGIEKAVATMYEQEENLMGNDTADMREMMAYIGRALDARKS